MAGHTLDRCGALLFWKMKWMEDAFGHYLENFCKPGMHVVDIGANIGLYTLLLAKQVGETGHVWAFEPDQGNAAMLRHNVTANGYSNVTVVSRAVGATSGQGILYLCDAHHGDHRIFQGQGHRRKIPIEIVALDDFFLPGQRIDLIKIDVEGVEEMVLTGMQRILRDNRGLVIFMEVCSRELVPDGCSPEKTLKDLQVLGFQLSWIDERFRKVHNICDPADIMDKLKAAQCMNIIAGLPKQHRRD